MKNGFDTIATKTKTTSTKKTTKTAATVTSIIRSAVDAVITNKAEIKKLKADLATNEGLIINHVFPQQEKLARKGNYSKSFFVEGEDGSVTYTTTDRFNIPKEEDVHDEIKKIMGNKFENYFEYKRTITLKEKMQNDTKFIQRLVKAVSDAGMELGDAFEVTDKLVTKSDMDEKQFELPTSKLSELRTLIKQNKATVK